MKSDFLFMKNYTSYIKWVFMVIGAIKFKWLGAFLGFFTGLYIENILTNGVKHYFNSGNDENAYTRSITFTSYQNNLLILIAAILRSNQVITKAQSFYILKYFFRQFGERNGKALYQKLKETIRLDLDLQTATVFMASTTNRDGKIQIITFLFGIAFIDNILLPNEKTVLENIARAIGLTQNDFESIISQAKQRKTFVSTTKYVSVSSHYNVLGIKENSSNDEIKKAYRKLVLEYHPDRTKLDPKIAAQKFQEVQEAYDKIREVKGLK